MTETDIFTLGSVVCVTPVVGVNVQGEVMAFDQKARILVLSKLMTSVPWVLKSLIVIFFLWRVGSWLGVGLVLVKGHCMSNIKINLFVLLG